MCSWNNLYIPSIIYVKTPSTCSVSNLIIYLLITGIFPSDRTHIVLITSLFVFYLVTLLIINVSYIIFDNLYNFKYSFNATVILITVNNTTFSDFLICYTTSNKILKQKQRNTKMLLNIILNLRVISTIFQSVWFLYFWPNKCNYSR